MVYEKQRKLRGVYVKEYNAKIIRAGESRGDQGRGGSRGGIAHTIGLQH